MKTSSLETVIGALIIVVAAIFLIYSAAVGDVEQTDGYPIKANFNQVGGLQVGDSVRISGVKIGTVKAIDLSRQSFLAEVTATIEDDVQVPRDSSATVASNGLLGGNYLAISPGGDEENLRRNDFLEYTQDAQNLEELLGKFIFSIADSETNSDKDSTETSVKDTTPAPLPSLDDDF